MRSACRCFALFLALLTALGVQSSAYGQSRKRLRLRVLEMAGDTAYLDAGTEDGLRRGSRVRIGRARFRVQSASAHYAVVTDKRNVLREGMRGFALVVRNKGKKGTDGLSPVTPTQAYRGVWGKPVRPASQEVPERYVPLGEQLAARGERSYLIARAWASPRIGFNNPNDGSFVGGVQVRVRVDPFVIERLRLEADIAARYFSGARFTDSDSAQSRPSLYVRQLQLQYDDGGGLSASLGRLRYASALTGMLDGARVQTPLSETLYIAAFGGVVPRPEDGAPSLDARRFGVEVGYVDEESPYRPSLTLLGTGSHFGDGLDERRVAAMARLTAQTWGLGGYAEGSFFDADNVWGASSSELSAAGVDGHVRTGDLELRARFDARRPERSRWLASQLPTTFFCEAASTDGQNFSCIGMNEPRLVSSLRALYRVPNGSVAVGASHFTTLSSETSLLRAFALGRYGLVERTLYGTLGASGSAGSLLTNGAVQLGLAYRKQAFELGVDYHPRITFYNQDVRSSLDHRVDLAARWDASTTVSLLADADLFLGRDQRALLATLSLLWRPTW